MSELRQDLVSGDWVIVAPGRARRPDSYEKNKTKRIPAPKSACPFEDFARSGNTPLALYSNGGMMHPAGGAAGRKSAWDIAVIPNKYPALMHESVCATSFAHGIYQAMTGVGDQELIVTRDHDKSFSSLSPALAARLFRVFQERHRAAAQDSCLVYATTFLNYGPSVGSSVWHPHYQFAALPFVPPHILHSMNGEERYFKKHHRCVRCDIIRQEKKEKKRMIAENGSAIAFAPYASKRPFEVAILPKTHTPHFTDASSRALAGVTSLVQLVMRRLRQYAGDPDLNFFIHDAPLDGNSYPYHHWHIEVVPNVSRLGGLEYSTYIDINVVDPETAAHVLRGKKLGYAVK